MPSQADEEAHQLSYLHKHLGNILSLLADAVEGEVEGEGDESMVCNVVSLFCIFVELVSLCTVNYMILSWILNEHFTITHRELCFALKS